jgi:phage anti-repressor protein
METNLSITQNSTEGLQQLFEDWLKAESDGIEFPVPLHDYWWIAGHSTKQKCYQLVESLLSKGSDFLTSTVKIHKRGRNPRAYWLTCDAVKALCLAAQTEQGKLTRSYFIDAEKKWKLTQQMAPEVAQQVEMTQQLIDLEKLRLQNNQLLTSTATMHGKEFALQLMGQHDAVVRVEVPTIEVIDERMGAKFEGSTMKQLVDFLKQEHGIKIKNGSEAARILRRLGRDDLIAQLIRPVTQDYVPSEFFDEAIRVLSDNSQQMRIGEAA